MRKTAQTLLLFTFGAVFATISGCGKKAEDAKQAEPTKQERKEAIRPVRTVVVTAAAQSTATYFPGDVRARNEQRLGFRVGGKVATRRVEVGDLIKPGQVLATLDGQDVAPQVNAQTAQLEAARANTKWQTADLKRQQELRDKGFVSAAAIQRQEINLEAAAAQERAAAAGLANAQNSATFQTLRADRAGVVVGIDAEVGSVIAPGQTVVRVAQTGGLEIMVNVPEKSVAALQSAATLVAQIEAAGNALVQIKLRELSPVADVASRTFAARFIIENPPTTVKLGMTANVRFDSVAGVGIAVPLTAVVTRDGQARVWVVDPATSAVQPVNITTGGLTENGVLVTAGLSNGQRVVTAGASLLTVGQKVRLEGQSAASVPSAQIPAAGGVTK